MITITLVHPQMRLTSQVHSPWKSSRRVQATGMPVAYIQICYSFIFSSFSLFIYLFDGTSFF